MSFPPNGNSEIIDGMQTTSSKKKAGAPRQVVIAGFDGAQILDITGPAEIFASVGQDRSAPAYEVVLAGPRKSALSTTCGIDLSVDKAFGDFKAEDYRGIDTLVIAGGVGMRKNTSNAALMNFVTNAARHARRVTSVCTGAFVLAAAGLLDGKRAVTHWMYCNALEKNFPDITVDADAIYVRDGHVWTSAGVTAGMDLSLALIEEDLGRDVAIEIARQHVMFVMRPGGQSQFSAHLAAQQNHDRPFGDLLGWIAENVDKDLSVPSLARQAAMSERNFARQFTRETGTTPARFVEAARVQAARQLLEESARPIDQIAFQSGFSNAERMRRTFHRHLGISPQDYRARFGRQSQAPLLQAGE